MRHLLGGLRVPEYVKPAIVYPKTSLEIAHDLMEMDHVGGLPVISDGKLVGMVTRTDILKVEPSQRAQSAIDNVMSDKLVVACPDDDLFSALTKMISRGVGRLPVVDPNSPKTILGIITREDTGRAIQRSRSAPS